MPSPFKLRQRLKSALGREAPAAPTPKAPAPPAPTAAPVERPVAKAAPSPAAVPPAAESKTGAGTKKVSQEKIEKHRNKARKGVLKWLGEQENGESPMKEMHDYSERRYFIAHKPFSDMMEFYIENDLITFSHGTGIAVITDDGREFAAK